MRVRGAWSVSASASAWSVWVRNVGVRCRFSVRVRGAGARTSLNLTM